MSFLFSLFTMAAAAAQPVQSSIEAAGPNGALSGTLLAPKSTNAPVVLIIPGSGPTDRDGNNPFGMKAASYRLLAEALAERGIASVRIDKRGMFASKAAVPDPNAVTIADYAADVRSWVARIKERTGADCIWLLGHSEGGLVALAARQSLDVCGLLLVAAPGRPVGEALREQLRANPANAPVLDQALAAIGKLEAGQTVDTADMNPMLMPLFAPQVQRYLIDLLSHDPAALLGGYERPVLVLQGQLDIQVGEADARRLAGANPGAQLVLLPRVNHVLKELSSEDRAANLASYADPNLPIAPSVVNAVASFLTSARRGSR
jgi:pimeloyl-ACP methyl ester carboxylesterase